ncbi:DUF393 domain-containing protein [Nubsella zeaxanthinifaciens]|jgi:predicted DCC family thiol-disulfide oxidoreductase YuxK|uniref:DUF393 domain-containing protein n=1 Tax=Nubsella zeaxanthinifaciens TaxID=392412 RepID=UPI000DE20C2E|nr:DUF393 domain-containing protein [Nubsella zeaxanthinifaciens]
MKTLANHVILYDANCPMCHLYTGAFVKTKMLDKDGRVPYQQLPEQLCPYVDMKRAINEIALVNVNTGKVTYGVQSLLKVIGNAVPFLNPLFSFKPFVWIMSKAYALVSYNRKVIVPAKAAPNELMPSFKLHYRLLYLIISWLVVAYVLTDYAKLISPAVPLGGSYREYFICGGQILFQGLVCLCYKPTKAWDYLGNMMTISLAGSLLLLPIIWIGAIFNFSNNTYIILFLATAGLMFLEHLRRCSLLSLGLLLSASWMVYRMAVLGFILY